MPSAATDTVTKPRRANWTTLSITLHWVVVLFLIGQFLNHGFMEDAWHTYRDGESPPPDVLRVAWLHVAIGILVLLSALTRLWDRFARGRPPYEERTPTWAAWLSRVTHAALYAVLIALPLTGMAAWFGEIRGAGRLHGTLWTVLLVLATLHIAGALSEHFVFRTGALRRMLSRG